MYDTTAKSISPISFLYKKYLVSSALAKQVVIQNSVPIGLPEKYTSFPGFFAKVYPRDNFQIAPVSICTPFCSSSLERFQNFIEFGAREVKSSESNLAQLTPWARLDSEDFTSRAPNSMK